MAKVWRAMTQTELLEKCPDTVELQNGYSCGHFPEMTVHMNEYALSLDQQHIWFRATDTDSDCPLMVRLKPTWQNVKKRSPEMILKRHDKNRKKQHE